MHDSLARLLIAATLGIAFPASVLAEHEPGLPEASCRILAKAGPDAAAATSLAGDAFVVPVLIDCEHLDASDTRMRIDRVDITYEVHGAGSEPLRPRRQALRGTCNDGRAIDVTLLTEAQKRSASLRGAGGPTTITAHLSFRGRQASGKPRWCFGSMEWEFELRGSPHD
jgi:hypothetical protein